MSHKVMLCPHGVDVSVRLKSYWRLDEYVTDAKQYVCLKCAAEAGIIALLKHHQVETQ